MFPSINSIYNLNFDINFRKLIFGDKTEHKTFSKPQGYKNINTSTYTKYIKK